MDSLACVLISFLCNYIDHHSADPHCAIFLFIEPCRSNESSPLITSCAHSVRQLPVTVFPRACGMTQLSNGGLPGGIRVGGSCCGVRTRTERNACALGVCMILISGMCKIVQLMFTSASCELPPAFFENVPWHRRTNFLCLVVDAMRCQANAIVITAARVQKHPCSFAMVT